MQAGTLAKWPRLLLEDGSDSPEARVRFHTYELAVSGVVYNNMALERAERERRLRLNSGCSGDLTKRPNIPLAMSSYDRAVVESTTAIYISLHLSILPPTLSLVAVSCHCTR